MNSSDSVSAHWHGFTDTESGIATYYWCFGTRTYVNNRKRDKTECSVIGWTNAGLHVSASSNISTEIPQGNSLYLLVIYILKYPNVKCIPISRMSTEIFEGNNNSYIQVYILKL